MKTPRGCIFKQSLQNDPLSYEKLPLKVVLKWRACGLRTAGQKIPHH